MRVTVTIKDGPKVVAEATGREVSDTTVTIGDLKKVIEVEHLLERITGLRFHITTAY